MRIKTCLEVNNVLAILQCFTISNNHSTIDKGDANRGIYKFTIIVHVPRNAFNSVTPFRVGQLTIAVKYRV